MNILLVEDHDDTRSVLSRMLSAWGHDVATMKDMRSALERLGGSRFDAIVSDIALPDGTGYELMSEARRAGVSALGIAISAYPYPPDVNEPKVTGFDHHLNKPFTPRQLRSLLEKEDPTEIEVASTR